MREVAIERVAIRVPAFQDNLRVVILKEQDGGRYLPVWIWPADANAIVFSLRDAPVTRPATHDLVGTVIRAMGGTVTHVLISDCVNETFYAKVCIESKGMVHEVDSSLGDALILAALNKMPIYAEEKVMQEASVTQYSELCSSLLRNPNYILTDLWPS